MRLSGRAARFVSITPVPTPSHDLEGLDNTNMVCDLANGVCIPAHEQQPVENENPQSMIQQEQHNNSLTH